MSSSKPPIGERWSRPAVMGVLNVTPDSFSDGGRFVSPADAIAHGRALVEEGADLVDVGGESTRPGADPVTESEELRRVVPVLEALAGDAAVDRHEQGGRRASRAGARRRARERRDGAPRRPGARGRRRRARRLPLSHAHAGRASHDAGGPALRRRRLRGRSLPRRAGRAGRRGGSPAGVHLHRPRHRLRQDARPEPRARSPPRRARRARAARSLVGLSRKSTLGKVLGDPEATTGTVAASVGGGRRGVRARRVDAPRARRPRDGRGPRRRGRGRTWSA